MLWCYSKHSKRLKRKESATSAFQLFKLSSSTEKPFQKTYFNTIQLVAHAFSLTCCHEEWTRCIQTALTGCIFTRATPGLAAPHTGGCGRDRWVCTSTRHGAHQSARAGLQRCIAVCCWRAWANVFCPSGWLTCMGITLYHPDSTASVPRASLGIYAGWQRDQ